MGVRLATATAAVINNAAATSTETILFTTNPLITAQDGALIIVLWFFTLTIGTGGTGVTIRCRRGTVISGVVINPGANAVTVTAGNTVVLSGMAGDTGGFAFGGAQYSLTAQVTGATANSTFGDAFMLAFSL
jgi:hypothetical protein